jgi:pyridoxine 5-phosphate synthase
MRRLGVNLDHVATLRNARGGTHPDVLRAAQLVKAAGADGITLHLREDRRHIRDADVRAIRAWDGLPLNFEMAATDEMLEMALEIRPHACCLVPEKREELTTEGGLDVAGRQEQLSAYIRELKQSGARISLFIDPVSEQIAAAKACGADIVELHTGSWCDAGPSERPLLFTKLEQGVREAHAIGLEVHAGHGLDYETAKQISALSEVKELNIGHFMMGEALFDGLETVVKKMREAMC